MRILLKVKLEKQATHNKKLSNFLTYTAVFDKCYSELE